MSSLTDPAFPVAICVDATRSIGEWRPVWRFFGADEPNYATMKDGKKLLAELGELSPGHVFFRAHNLLTTGDGVPALKWGSTNAYTEDERGRPVYNWTILDSIFDTYLERGVRPYVQVGFMPEALSVNPDPYRHHWTPAAKYDEIYTGWAYPPKDYERWAELIRRWVAHSIERYGRAEVERWYWEVWNEPNIGYWRGTPEEFHRLHDVSDRAIRRALPTARVGGPDSAGGGTPFFKAFLEHCLRGVNYATGETGTPLDFVAFHAKGAPSFAEDHVRMGIANQLRNIDSGFALIASFPELKGIPIVIGESDPDGCAACQGPQLGYRNGTMYSVYTAACFARTMELADQYGVNLEGVLTWAFEFEDQPYFAGFRVLATNGIDLPVMNVFRMFARMGGRRMEVRSDAVVPLDVMLREGVRDRPDVSAVATYDGDRLCLLLWHYHDDDLPGPPADVLVRWEGFPPSFGGAKLRHYRIDEDHSNAYTLWKGMGSPQHPGPDQYETLLKAGKLAEMEVEEIVMENTLPEIRLALPRQAVSLLVLERNDAHQ